MNLKMILSTIAAFGMVALSGLPAFARDVVLRADSANARATLRSTPSNNAPVRSFESSGDRVQIIDRQPGANGSIWYHVRSYRTGADGWVDELYTRPLASGGLGQRDNTVTDTSRRHLIDYYEVRLFPRGGRVLLNVFDRNINRTILNGVPVSVTNGRDGVTYRGQNVVLFIHNTRDEKTITITR